MNNVKKNDWSNEFWQRWEGTGSLFGMVLGQFMEKKDRQFPEIMKFIIQTNQCEVTYARKHITSSCRKKNKIPRSQVAYRRKQSELMEENRLEPTS